MRVYSIFDDFGDEPQKILRDAGVELTVHPLGQPRPDDVQMKNILEEYDGVIIGTSQKLQESFFENITTPRVIATASVGLDHIKIPAEKKHLVTVINTPKANAQSVAEYTMGCALSCCKRLVEGNELYLQGQNNKKLSNKPEDLCGRVMGVIGAGNISKKIMQYADFFGMHVLCWTAHPENHQDLCELGVQFTGIEELVKTSDVISVNLPNKDETKNLISAELVSQMKDTAIFISVSRLDTIDLLALLEKADQNPNFYVCVDIDLQETVVKSLQKCNNVLITPHIAGGTVETRKRMFCEVADGIAALL